MKKKQQQKKKAGTWVEFIKKRYLHQFFSLLKALRDLPAGGELAASTGRDEVMIHFRWKCYFCIFFYKVDGSK